MRLYKLTDAQGQTQGNTQWGENIAHTASGAGEKLCTDGVIHAYKTPLQAVFMNPVHCGYDLKTALLWESEGEVVANDCTKIGCKTLTTIRTVPLPSLTTEQRIAIAIRAALLVYADEKFVTWAHNWLSGADRTADAANAAADATLGEAFDAAYAAYATYAAFDAARAAYAVVDAAYAAYAAYAARAVVDASKAAADKNAFGAMFLKILQEESEVNNGQETERNV